jgi:hypothetical protein
MSDHETEIEPSATVEDRPTLPGADRPARPVTGDRAVDDALAAFDRALGDGPAAQAEAAAEAHRALQARLTAPPPPPAVPGEARPGPRR